MTRLRIVALFATALVAASAFAEGASTPGELPLEAFAQLPLMQDAELSPDGSHVAFFYPLKGRNHLIIQPVFNADQRKVIPPPGELEFRWINWANDNRLVFSAQFSGERYGVETTETRLGSIKRDGSDSQWIIKAKDPESSTGSKLSRTAQGVAPQMQDDIVSWLPDERDYILVSLDDDFDAKDEVRKVNVNNGDYKKVRGGFRGVQNWMADKENVVRLGWGYHQSEFVVMFLNAEGDWTNATRSDWWDRGFSPQEFTDDPMVVYAVGPGGNGSKVIVKMNISDGTVLETVFSNGEMDVAGMQTDSWDGRPIGVNYVSHLPRTKYFDKEYDKLQRTAEKAFAGMSVEIESLSANHKQILVKVSSDTDPGVMYYWDREAKSMDVLAELMPGLTPELLSAVKPVSYPARDNYSVPGYLTLPTGGGEKNLPAIVLPHGGPAARDDQQFWFLTQFLASRGYAVFQPNFRGSTGYG
ncbi:MAG: alpha/beta hydrolase family protein [Gammaproteobacteria bacterium]